MVTMSEIVPVEALSPKDQRMERAGATRELAYKTFVEGTSAMTMTLDKFGEEHYAPDHSTRIRAGEMIAKMRGDIKPETVVDNRVVNINGVSDDILKGLIGIVADVSQQLRDLKGSGKQTGEIIDVVVDPAGFSKIPPKLGPQ